MAAIILPHRWLKQPDAPIRVNRGHPLSRELFIAISGKYPLVNLVNLASVVAANNVQASIGPGGHGLTWSSTANVGVRINLSTVLTNGFAGSGKGVSYLMLADPPSSTTRYVPFLTGDGATPESAALFNADRVGTATAGMFAVQTNGNNGGEAAGCVDGALKTFDCVWAAPNQAPTIYVKGRNATTAASASGIGAINDSGASDYVGGYLSSGFAANGFKQYLLLVANTEWTVAERIELAANPWQVFEEARRRLYFFAQTAGDQAITATGIGGAEAFGTARLDFQIDTGTIASLEAFGTARLDLELALSGIATAEAFGTARLDHIVEATGIASLEAFGTAQLDLALLFAGIASLEAFGSHAVNLDTEQSITSAGAIASLEAFGTARLDFDLLAAALASAEAFGTAQLDLNIVAQAIGTAEAFGDTLVELDTSQTVTPDGVASLEGFGTAQLDLALLLSAVSSEEAFGSHTITGGASTFILTGRTFRDEGGRVFRAPRKGRTIH